MDQDDASVELQALIDRLGQGDEAARRQLLERAVRRLRGLAARMLGGSSALYTRMRHVGRLLKRRRCGCHAM